MISRRAFLQTCSLVSLSPMLPSFLVRTALAAPATRDARVLVVVQLDGGNDGINTVVPFGDDGYGRARQKLRLKADELHKLNDHVALHPSMRGMKELFDDGRLAIVQGVGYPNPNRSHFESMKIWHTAQVSAAEQNGYGWLGRSLDQMRGAKQSSRGGNAIFVGEQETPLALWGRRSSATTLSRADDLHLQLNPPNRAPRTNVANSTNGIEQFVTKQVLSAYAAAEDFGRQSLATSNASYPDSQLASRLKLIAKLVKSDCHSRVFYTLQGGYDTHSTQLFTHAQLLREFSNAVKAFYDDLQAAGLTDRVVLLAFSEFGRRVRENDSQGTDHGTAGPVFVAGGEVRGGLFGKTPNLVDLESGDLKMHVDFRSVYATPLDNWLGVPSKEVLGGQFEELRLFAT